MAAFDKYLDNARIYTVRIVPKQGYLINQANPSQHGFHPQVNTQESAHQVLQAPKERMLNVCTVINPVVFLLLYEVSGIGELVQLLSDGVGGFIEFLCDAPQVAPVPRTDEEFYEEPQTGPRCDQ